MLNRAAALVVAVGLLRCCVRGAALLFASGSALASTGSAPPSGCQTSDVTRLTLTTRTGDRILMALQRRGDQLTGFAQMHLKDGRMPLRGPVSGRLLASAPVGRRGFRVTGIWQAPGSGGYDAWGVLGRGAGTGEILETRTHTVTITTVPGCPRWPQEFYLDAAGNPGKLPAPRYTCVPGYVWRMAHPWDRVCVTPEARDWAAREAAESARYTEVGPDGQPRCRLPFFPRQGYPGDTTCAELMSGLRMNKEDEDATEFAVNLEDGKLDDEQLPHCQRYADAAVREVAKHRELGCPVDGPRWTAARQPHLEWCMANMLERGREATEPLTRSESDARQNATFRCGFEASGERHMETPPLAHSPVAGRSPDAVRTMPDVARPARPSPVVPDAARAETGGIAAALVPRVCRPGYVHRQARPSDYVCVTPESKRQIEIDAAQGLLLWAPSNGPRPWPCVAGYVWREAFPGDDVCVLPARRAQVREENRLAAENLQPSSPGMENDTDRGGSDYRSFFLDARQPGLCQDACLKEVGRCRAWTYVRPGVQGDKPVCYLKSSVPQTSANTCCISGVAPDRSDAVREPGRFAPKGPDTVRGGAVVESGGFAPPAPGKVRGGVVESGGVTEGVGPGMENNVDRPGSDYNRFVLPTASAKNCEAVCAADRGCAAWTYVRPGVQQKEAVCYVKRSAPAPVSNSCCISGRKSLNPAAVRQP